MQTQQDLIGLIPAAGLAQRLQSLNLNCSKEITPIGSISSKSGLERPKPVCAYLLESMVRAGAQTIHIVLRKGKWDIPTLLGDGSDYDVSLSYLIMNQPFGVPYTINQARDFARGKTVLFGFPDIICDPQTVYKKLLAKLHKTKADVVLGLFPVSNSRQWDSVKTDADGNVLAVSPKSSSQIFEYAWANAVWADRFTSSIEAITGRTDSSLAGSGELSVGHVLQKGIEGGLKISSCFFKEGWCIDIGTPEGLRAARKKLTADF